MTCGGADDDEEPVPLCRNKWAGGRVVGGFTGGRLGVVGACAFCARRCAGGGVEGGFLSGLLSFSKCRGGGTFGGCGLEGFALVVVGGVAVGADLLVVPKRCHGRDFGFFGGGGASVWVCFYGGVYSLVV